MKRLEGFGAIPQVATHAPAADTAAVVTLAASTDGSRHVVDWISWSYDKKNVAAETLTLAIAGITLTWYIPIGAAEANPPDRHMSFSPGIVANENEAVTATLSAQATTSKGVVNVGYR